jgi:hypothetical protein
MGLINNVSLELGRDSIFGYFSDGRIMVDLEVELKGLEIGLEVELIGLEIGLEVELIGLEISLEVELKGTFSPDNNNLFELESVIYKSVYLFFKLLLY